MVSLIGATTSNPYFAVNSALLSRSQLFQLEPLTPDDIETLLRRALSDPVRGLANALDAVDEDAIGYLAEVSEGDARRALSALEIAVLSCQADAKRVTREVAVESLGNRLGATMRRVTIITTRPAPIKSIRGSDRDAAMYWLARMLEGGEDVRFLLDDW